MHSKMSDSSGSTLILKALTMSDTSFGVSKSGRVVLPRAQVECCLDQLLRLGGAGSAAASLKANLVPRLSVNLSILDEYNTEFIVTLKTWQNVVSGQHRPTFVLENTSAFMEAHPMKPGDILAIVVTEDNKLQMRTDMCMIESHASGIKRKLSNPTSFAGATTSTAAAAQLKRRGSVISLKRNNSSMGPSTPAPSSPEQSALAISASAGSIPHSSADLAAATALMFMASDTSSNFSLKNEDTISSGVSGSSPAALCDSELSMESQITLTKKPKITRIKYKAPTPLPAKKHQASRQGSLPPPPVPASAFVSVPPSKNNSNNDGSVDPVVSPFQEALLSYSLETLDTLPHFPPPPPPQQQQQQQPPKSHFCFNHGPQQQHEQRQRAQSSYVTSSTAAPTSDHFIQGLMHQEAAITRPVVQSGATVWPEMDMVSHAAMVVANAIRNFRVSQHHQQRAHQEQHTHSTNVRLVQNQQHGVAISNASTELPLLVGGGGLGLVAPSHVEAFLSQFGY
ncbi:hypothetical protein Ndes2437B_g09090 [Nannochloris sp. 'desiccata']